MFFPIVKAWNGDGKSVEWRSSKAFSLVSVTMKLI